MDETLDHLLPQLVALRHDLHRIPELAGTETDTAARLLTYLESQEPDRLLTGLGGNGLAALYHGPHPGPTMLLRCELDALPIQETTTASHRSARSGLAHSCGHDGHMATLAGVAALVRRHPLPRGRLVLLFQPAEETAEGAAAVLRDPDFAALEPDCVYAWHNIPGYPLGRVLLRSGVVAASSVGLAVRLRGTSAHAAHPERARSPALALAELIRALTELPDRTPHLRSTVLSTVIHARLGTVSFGTTPGEAEVLATLRSVLGQDLQLLRDAAARQVSLTARRAGLDHDLRWTEEFPATRNTEELVELLRAACVRAGIEAEDLESPFLWSEDFSHFTARYPGALFCIGAGEDHPPVHHPDYDFPDPLIETGLRVLHSAIALYLGQE